MLTEQNYCGLSRQTKMFQFALEKTRKKVCRSRQLYIGSNDDMKSPKRHTTFKLLIFLLKWFSKSFFTGNYQKNVRNGALSVVDKKSSFNFAFKLSPNTLKIAYQSFHISKFSLGACSQIPLDEGSWRPLG